MADLKMGTTVAGSTIWSQSNLPLLPSGNRLTFKGWKVYTETDKPTAEDIGALSLANGGTVAKNTTFGQSITVADNVTATEVYLSSGETIARSGNSAFINFKRTDLTNTPVQETTVQSINAYDGNSQLMSAYTVSKLTSGGNKIYLRGYKDGIQNTLLTIDTQSQQVSVEQGTFRVVGATTLSSLNATSATISGDVSAQKITPTDWSNIDQRYMTGYMKNFTGSSFGSVVDKNDVYTINGTLLSDGPKGNATYVGILVNYRSTRNTGVSLVQKYFDNDGVTYIRKGVGSTSAYVWIGGDANGWSKIYDTSNKPTLVELNAAKSGINSDITSLTALSGSLRLGGDPVNDYDATTKGWVQTFIASVKSVLTSWSVINTDTVSPPANTVVNGGKVSSKYKVGATDNFSADFYAQAAIGNGITEARVEAHGTNTAVMRFNSEGNLGLTGEVLTSSVNGRGGAFVPAIRKLKDQQSTDGVKSNYLSLLENIDCKVANYIFTRTETGVAEYSWNFTRSDNISIWFSMRSDSTMHTPLGQVAIQGSDVRIKDNFKLPKSGAWERIEQIGIVEFTYKGNSVPQRGWLAQQMGTIDPVYVFEGGQATDENGNAFDIINVNDKAVIADLVTVVQELQNKVIALEKQIANS